MDWFWHALWIAFVVIPVTIAWLACVFDIFARSDLSGWAKVGWLLLVLVLPLIGAMIYLIARPGVPWFDRDITPVVRPEPGPSVADELAKVDDMHRNGVLTDAEFEAAKARLLGEPGAGQPVGKHRGPNQQVASAAPQP